MLLGLDCAKFARWLVILEQCGVLNPNPMLPHQRFDLCFIWHCHGRCPSFTHGENRLLTVVRKRLCLCGRLLDLVETLAGDGVKCSGYGHVFVIDGFDLAFACRPFTRVWACFNSSALSRSRRAAVAIVVLVIWISRKQKAHGSGLGGGQWPQGSACPWPSLKSGGTSAPQLPQRFGGCV
ncbi:hypothetical protein CLU84_2435 [Comamonas sp. 26]|nr:hypothetical protein CLU84_2435 [Comamonas sp. 26]